MRNRLWILVLLIVAALAGLRAIWSWRAPSLADGVWVGPQEEAVLVLRFLRTRGLLSGTVHELRGSRQEWQWGFAGTHLSDGRLRIEWGRGVSLVAMPDHETGVLAGQLSKPDGSEVEARFRRAAVGDLPGLEALPGRPVALRSPAPGSGWPVADPAEVGIRRRHLERTLAAIVDGEAGLLHALLVAREGHLVVEEYFHGYTRDDLHETLSFTKSVVSLLVGIAVEQGLIESVEIPVLDFFPDLAELARPEWREVTVRHLLQMTAGVDWREDEIVEAQGAGPPLFRKVLRRRLSHSPGSRFLYNGGELNLLAGVLHRSSGLHADEFAARHLFAPLGITDWDWDRGKTEGYPSLAGTLRLRPLDMAKIGQMVLDGGRWRERQIVPAAWLRESTTRLVTADGETHRYGFLWWLPPPPFDEPTSPVISATGWGSQFLHVVPDLEMVLVTTGGNHFNGKTFAVDGVLVRRLVPGVERR